MSAMFNISWSLKKIGRSVRWWQARLSLAWGASCLLAALMLFSIADLFFRMGTAGRSASSAILFAVACVTGWFVIKTIRNTWTLEGVAALVEKSFPELDNHLINYIQFSRDEGGDPFKAAYISSGPPDLKKFDISRMKDKRAHQRAFLVLALVGVFIVTPWFFVGKAWEAAVLRMLNPFSQVQPVTLTRLLDVTPGNTVIPQGSSAVLMARVDGHPGHRVAVDIHPDDAVRTTYDIGRINWSGVQEFTYALPRVNTRLLYRFRAGDASPSEWYTLSVRIPPSLTRIQAVVTPPEYTRRAPDLIDIRENELVVPFGSLLELSVTGSDALESLRLSAPNSEPMEMSLQDEGDWSGSLYVTESGILAFNAADSFGATLSEEISCVVKPDNPPEIEILAPLGNVILPRGESPRILFRVSDDYGITEVHIEQIEPGQPHDMPGAVLHTWRTDNAPELRETWRGGRHMITNEVIAFRIAALDNNPYKQNISRSQPIIFSVPSPEEAAESRKRMEESALTGLSGMIELQKLNIEQTRTHRANLTGTSPDSWQSTVDRQVQIRTLTREILHNPIRPLGGQTDTVNKLFLNEMPLAIEALEMVTSSAPASVRPATVSEALRLQETILRGLNAAQVAAERASGERSMTGISAMLQALIDNQQNVLTKSRSCATEKIKVSPELVEEQDMLASDMVEFTRACEREAGSVRSNDPHFADMLVEMAAQTEKRAIRNDMLMASDRLDRNIASEAVEFSERALGNLQELQAFLEGVRVEKLEEEKDVMLEALQHARAKIEKTKELHERMIESMESVRGQVSKNEELFDVFMDEYREFLKNTEEAMLTVPTDLHVFTELNPANDLVEDVFSIFEEVEQTEGSDKLTAEDVTTLAYAKEQEFVEQMGEILEALDNMERWLEGDPDDKEVVTEAFDLEEMPEAGIAAAPLPTQLEDLIGDLLDESEEMAEAADDGATTHAQPAMEAGHAPEGGDIASFDGSGVSGNVTPDHKEQDGRSGVGREAMSVGETVAGSGTLSKGDDNIQARRTEDPTQSGQVDVDGEGHAMASGGGKQATGKAEDYGMSDGIERMDSTERGSWEDMAALMAERADSIFAQASLQSVRINSLQEAAHHLRQSGDAIARGNIDQMEEFKNLAVSSLLKARVELEAGPTGSIDVTDTPRIVDSMIGSGPDLAPQQYRNAVSDYYRLLNEAL